MGVIFLKKISDTLSVYITKNKVLFIFCTLIFLLGLAVGAQFLKFVPEADFLNIRAGMDTYFSVSEIQSVSKWDSALSCLGKNLSTIFLIWISGFFVFLIPVIFLQLFLKGLRLGFSVAFLCGMYGAKGISFSFVQVLAGNFIFVPMIIFFSVYSIKFARKTYRLKPWIKKRREYITNFEVIFLLLVITVGMAMFYGYVLSPFFKVINAIL